MKAGRIKLISLLVGFTMIVSGSSMAVYGTESNYLEGEPYSVDNSDKAYSDKTSEGDAIVRPENFIAPEEPVLSEESGTAEDTVLPGGAETAETPAVLDQMGEPQGGASQENEITAKKEEVSPSQEISVPEDPEKEVFDGVMQLLCEAENADPGELSLTATKGVYWFQPSTGYDDDLTDTYIYDDELLKGDSLGYNRHLATMSYEMAITSISSLREPNTPEGYANKSRNLRAYLEDNGFTDFDLNQAYTEKMTETSMGVACAHKKITDNGKDYTLLVIAPRSAGYESEWASNFMMGAEGDHEGFEIGKNHILEFVKQYVSDYGIAGDIKVWTAGYSRGAAVTDLVAAALLRDPNGALGDSVTLAPENLYCYTFGTPRNADVNGDYQDEKYLYVHNTFPLYDIITALPPADLGFERYGSNTPLVPDDENAKERMLALFKELNPAFYETYMNGGDPDGFRPKTIDLEALANGELKLMDDEESYLPADQGAFISQIVESSLLEAVGTRENYKAIYQDPMVHFGEYLLTHTSEAGDLVGGMMQSPYGIPAGASMYMYIVTEKLLNNEIQPSEHNSELIYAFLQEAFGLIEKMDFESIPEFSELRDMFEEYASLPVQGIQIMLADPDILDRMSGLTSALYSLALRDGLEGIGAGEELIDKLTSYEDSRAMSRVFAYLFFEDGKQKENDTDLLAMNANMIKHAATFLGNGASYMVPHLHEAVVSWLKVQDDYYNGIEKENPAQIAGYRRLYVAQPEGVDVTGYVKDSSGNVTAIFKNGQLISRTNSWISMTTSDNGNWLRLPLDDQYTVDFEISDDTVLSIVVSEYAVYENKEVRIETGDSNISWQDLMLRTKDRASLIISALKPEENGSYLLNSDAPYYMDLLRRFTITYLLDGGILDQQTGSVVLDVDNGTSIVLPAPTREGYTFAYWQGSRYNAGDTYTVMGDHTFTAVWNKIADKKETAETPSGDNGGKAEAGYANKESIDTFSVSHQNTAPMTGDSGRQWTYYTEMCLACSVLLSAFLLRRRQTVEK